MCCVPSVCGESQSVNLSCSDDVVPLLRRLVSCVESIIVARVFVAATNNIITIARAVREVREDCTK